MTMNAFSQIVQYCIHKNKEICYIDSSKNTFMFWEKVYKIIDRGILPNSMFSFYLYISENKTTPKEKFKLLNAVLTNPFYSQDAKEHFFKIFSQAQNIYWKMNRFGLLYKLKKQIKTVSYDIYMTPIAYGDKNVITILHNNKFYLFSITDLVNIINNSLSNSQYLYSDPLPIKNPYTNQEFGKSNLYNIYFFIKNSGFVMPILFYHFFLCNFNLHVFFNTNEIMLREYVINKYLETCTIKCSIQNIMFMLDQDKFGRLLHISSKFSKEKLAKIMKPYLHLYFIQMYSLDKNRRLQAKTELARKLKRFVMNNPHFGKRKNIKAFGFNIPNEPNSDYIKFNEEEDFMNSHKSTHTVVSTATQTSNEFMQFQQMQNNNNIYSNSSDDETEEESGDTEMNYSDDESDLELHEAAEILMNNQNDDSIYNELIAEHIGNNP